MSCGCGSKAPDATTTSSSSDMITTTPVRGLPPTRPGGMSLRPRISYTDTPTDVLLREPCDDTIQCGATNQYGIPGCCAGNSAGPVGGGRTETSQETPVPGSEHDVPFPDPLPGAGITAAVGIGLLVLLLAMGSSK